MKKIKAMTFGFMSKPGELSNNNAKDSLRKCVKNLGINTIVLPIVANQNNAQSVQIDYHNDVPKDSEVIDIICFAKSIGLDVILKPMVNCLDGTWRAHINFFDVDVKCEPKWKDWFLSYEHFIIHYAQIAERTGCIMFVIGCELVNSDKREEEWRKIVESVRKKYKGLLTYNCDKYQEDRLSWWDDVDVISSSGYYPYNEWIEELTRIEKVVNYYNKPFFFCEAGAPSIEGGELLPNDWKNEGKVSQDAQYTYYKSMFEACREFTFVNGFALWDWKSQIYKPDQAVFDTDYAVFNKKSEKLIKNFFNSI